MADARRGHHGRLPEGRREGGPRVPGARDVRELERVKALVPGQGEEREHVVLGRPRATGGSREAPTLGFRWRLARSTAAAGPAGAPAATASCSCSKRASVRCRQLPCDLQTAGDRGGIVAAGPRRPDVRLLCKGAEEHF